MTPEQTAQLLELVTAGTGRTFGRIDLVLWHKILARLDSQRCQDAVLSHFTHKPGVWLEPGHVWALAKTTTDGEAENVDLTRECEHGTYCQVCKLVHHAGECGTPRLEPRPMRAALRAAAAAFERPPSATPALEGGPRPAKTAPKATIPPHAAAQLEVERARQLAQLAHLTEAETPNPNQRPN